MSDLTSASGGSDSGEFWITIVFDDGLVFQSTVTLPLDRAAAAAVAIQRQLGGGAAQIRLLPHSQRPRVSRGAVVSAAARAAVSTGSEGGLTPT